MVAVLGWLLAVRFYGIIRALRTDIIKLAILRGIYSDNVTLEDWERCRLELEVKIEEAGKK
jgi:hypothetical protein